MKLLYGAIVLACVPIVLAGNDAVYPTEKIATFVFEKVDVTTLPSATRPKPVKGKKMFSDYGYVGAGGRREAGAHRSAARGFTNFDRSIGSAEVWHLRLREQPITK